MTYYYPYIALWVEDNGQKYSTISDLYGDKGAVLEMVSSGGRIYKWNRGPDVGATPEGWIPEKKGLTFVTWCTKDGKEWDYDNAVVTENIDLYPIWQDEQMRKYYPYIHNDGTKTYPCNSIIEGSIPEVPRTEAERQVR